MTRLQITPAELLGVHLSFPSRCPDRPGKCHDHGTKKRASANSRERLPSGDEGNHDVSSMVVEIGSSAVVNCRCPRIGVAGGNLDLTERDPGIESRHDEG